jgi:hypothetical protein
MDRNGKMHPICSLILCATRNLGTLRAKRVLSGPKGHFFQDTLKEYTMPSCYAAYIIIFSICRLPIKTLKQEFAFLSLGT